MTTGEFMAIAPMFTSEDVTRPSMCRPFRHGHYLFATDGHIALACDASGLDADEIQETADKMQRHIGDRIVNDHLKECEDKIESCKYCKYDLGKVADAVCASFADIEPEMMWLRMNEPDEDDPDDDFEPDSVRHVHEAFTSVIMANCSRSVIAGYYASLIVGLMNNFGPVEAYASVNSPHDKLYFRGPKWKCVLMPRLVKARGNCYEWNYYGGCAIADAQTGELVWGRDLAAVKPDMDMLRKGMALLRNAEGGGL